MQFENLKIRKDSKDLYCDISNIIESNKSIRSFFSDQILRATLSISNNIAEWFERDTENELKRFLYIARWSCGEVRSMLHILVEKWYIKKDEFEKYYDKTKHISIMLYKYIKKIKERM